MKYLLLTLATLLTLSTYSQDFKAINETSYRIHSDSGMKEMYTVKRSVTFFLTPKYLVVRHIPTSSLLGSTDTFLVRSLSNVDDKNPKSKKWLFTKIVTTDKTTVLIWDTHVTVQGPVKKKVSYLFMYDRP
jgi:hypothetical protein